MVNYKFYTVAAYIFSTLPLIVSFCLGHGSRIEGYMYDQEQTVLENHQRRETTKTTLFNVRIFDGHHFGNLGTVVIDGARIESVRPGSHISHGKEMKGHLVNGDGGYLLPGFIDAHTHPENKEDLNSMTANGITTTLVQGCFSKSNCSLLKAYDGLTDVFYSAVPATAPGSRISGITGFPKDETLTDASQAKEFVARQLLRGADHIKLIVGPFPVVESNPTIDSSTVREIIKVAHDACKRTVAHAADIGSVEIALAAGADEIHHAASDHIVDEDIISKFLGGNVVLAPTLTKMSQILHILPEHFNRSKKNVFVLNKAGVPILAGSDAAHQPGHPRPILFGTSFHDELFLLKEAGLSEVDILRAATSNPAHHYGLFNRGVIKAGKRGDLVLLKNDPTKDINATRSVQRVWVAGNEYDLGGAAKLPESLVDRAQWPSDH